MAVIDQVVLALEGSMEWLIGIAHSGELIDVHDSE